MKIKIRILILTSILALLTLSGIQAYLISNTYQLKKALITNQVDQALDRLDDEAPAVDSIDTIWRYAFLRLIERYHSGQISKAQLLTAMRQKADSLNPSFIHFYNLELANKDLEYDVQYQQLLRHLSLEQENGSMDTIYNHDPASNWMLFGEKFPKEKGENIGNTTWSYQHDYHIMDPSGKAIPRSASFQISTTDRMHILDKEVVIFKKMSGIFLFSFLIFCFVIGLIFYSIRNFIQQKRLSDIKTDFINNITHELKTPLATLAVATKVLENVEVKKNPDALADIIQTISRQNQRLQKLIDQVLDHSLGSDALLSERVSVDVHPFIATIANDFQVLNPQKKIVTDFSSEKLEISVDRFHFSTALLNVLENAIKYGGKTIKITTRALNGTCCIQILDDGIGIERKHIPFIFDKFYRAEDSNVHNSNGLGLGLYYVDQIIKAHQGSVSLQSQKGVSTTIQIKLPCYENATISGG